MQGLTGNKISLFLQRSPPKHTLEQVLGALPAGQDTEKLQELLGIQDYRI